VEQPAVVAELGDGLQQRLVERAGRVVELVPPHRQVVDRDLDAPQQVGGDAFEAAPRVDGGVAAPRLLQLPVPDEGDRVRAGRVASPGVRDPFQVQVAARYRPACRDAGVCLPDGLVPHHVALDVAHLAQRPLEDVAGVVGQGRLG
jgi:hypothetical protein